MIIIILWFVTELHVTEVDIPASQFDCKEAHTIIYTSIGTVANFDITIAKANQLSSPAQQFDHGTWCHYKFEKQTSTHKGDYNSKSTSAI